MKEIRKFVTLIVILLLALMPGCSLLSSKHSSDSTNPAGPVISQTEPEIVNNTASGTASLKVIIAFPEDYALEVARQKYGTTTVGFKIGANMRANTPAPYVLATLYKYVGIYPKIPEIVVRQKAFVSEGKAEIKFSNLAELRNGSIELELVGCHIQGFTKFQGTVDIIENTACEAPVFPITPEGAIVTADYHILSELDIVNTVEYSRGPLYTARITFNDLGEPIGWTPDGYITNLITNQKYFAVQPLIISESPEWSLRDFAYLNGEFYVGGNERVYKIGPDLQTKTLYAGQPGVFTPAKDGDSLASATLPVISDMCVANGKIYVNSNMSTIVELDEKIGVYKSLDGGFWGSRLSVTENGDIFFVGHIQDLKCSVLKFTGKNSYVKIGPDEDYPNQQTSLISYEGGYLIANEHHITQVFPDGSSRVWLTIYHEYSYNPRLYIYKNQQGHIYIAANQMQKIWRVN